MNVVIVIIMDRLHPLVWMGCIPCFLFCSSTISIALSVYKEVCDYGDQDCIQTTRLMNSPQINFLHWKLTEYLQERNVQLEVVQPSRLPPSPELTFVYWLFFVSPSFVLPCLNSSGRHTGVIFVFVTL